MTPERRRQIERLYLVAIEQPPDRRSAWLTDACAGDAGLFREVEALLAQHAAATGTLDSRGPTVATGLVGEMNTTIGSGRRIGGYEILERIGAGGMGEVYRARDARLGRDVAIKILPRAWTSDPDRLARFRREARMLAALNHSNVATIHGVVEGDGLEALVLELVTGETLAERIAQSRDGRVPISEALSIARQIVDALDAAHEKGIVHRDLKPANIKVRPDGTIKVLDFGLAKLSPTEIDNRETGFASWDATQAPTTTNGRTREGLIVGTPAYMSPEQARGQVVDKRTDIWAFGCVLYELLSGQAAFAGETALDTLTAVVQRDPDWGVLPRDVPPGLVDLLRRCLEKDAARRPRDIGEIRSELVQPTGEAFTRRGAAGNAGHAAPAPTSVRRLAIATVGLALIAIAAVFVLRERGSISVEPSRSATPLTYRQLTALDSATQPTVSADQRMIAFIGGPHTSVPETGDPSQVYVKPLPDGDAVQLTRDEQVKFSPRFSPDGTRIVYSTISTSGFDTWVVPVIGGQAPRRLLQNAEGASWIGERLLFSFLTGKGITMAVASATESRSDQRTLFVEDGKMEHFSSLSPDGQQLLLAEMGFGGWESCRLAPVDGSSAGKKVGPQPSQCTSVAWSPDGKWMYFSADAGNGFHIWRQAFPAGQPEQITSGATEEEGISFSPDGRSFFTSVGTRQSTLWVHDAKGDRRVTSDAFAFNPVFSPDETKLYYLVKTSLGATVPYGTLWVIDLASGQRLRLLPDFQMEHFALADDGNRVALVAANERNYLGVWVATLDGSAAPRQLTAHRGLQAFFDARGNLFFDAEDPDGTFVYRARSDGSAPQRVIADPVRILHGVSPDGNHAAVWMTRSIGGSSNAVGIYPLDGGAPSIVCRSCGYRSGGGAGPPEVTWSRDGTTLYLALIGGASVFAIPLRPGAPVPAFPPDGLGSIEEAAALPGAKPMPVAGAVAGSTMSVYAYEKQSAQRNIYRVSIRD